MAWTTPATFIANQIVGASDLNTQLRDNLNYLFASRPTGITNYQNGSNYTTTSTSFVDVDATNVKLTLTLSGSRLFIVSRFVANYTNVANNGINFAFYSVGLNANGSTTNWQGNSAASNIEGQVNMVDIFTGLAAGSQTIRLRWAVSNGAGTGSIIFFSGTNLHYTVVMVAWEI